MNDFFKAYPFCEMFSPNYRENYEREDIAFPLQIAFQMGIGMTILFIVAIYLQWMPINLGMSIIVEWVMIACVFAAVFWCGFYICYYLVACGLNDKLNN